MSATAAFPFVAPETIRRVRCKIQAAAADGELGEEGKHLLPDDPVILAKRQKQEQWRKLMAKPIGEI